MRNNIFTYCIIVAITIFVTKLVIKESSSPVEEMYHKQLVTTIDSILNTRFDPDCYEEIVDSNSVTITQTRFSNILSPID